MPNPKKCRVTPIISEDEKNHWIQELTDIYTKTEDIYDFCTPNPKHQNQHWILPNGKLLNVIDHGDIKNPLLPLFQKIQKTEKPEFDMWTPTSVLDMIRISQNPKRVLAEIAIDSKLTSNQLKTLRSCVESINDVSDNPVSIAITYPTKEDGEDILREVGGGRFVISDWNQVIRYIRETQNRKEEFC